MPLAFTERTVRGDAGLPHHLLKRSRGIMASAELLRCHASVNGHGLQSLVAEHLLERARPRRPALS